MLGAALPGAVVDFGQIANLTKGILPLWALIIMCVLFIFESLGSDIFVEPDHKLITPKLA